MGQMMVSCRYCGAEYDMQRVEHKCETTEEETTEEETIEGRNIRYWYNAAKRAKAKLAKLK